MPSLTLIEGYALTNHDDPDSEVAEVALYWPAIANVAVAVAVVAPTASLGPNTIAAKVSAGAGINWTKIGL